jgi:ribosome-associated translation inhibitor RaiA
MNDPPASDRWTSLRAATGALIRRTTYGRESSDVDNEFIAMHGTMFISFRDLERSASFETRLREAGERLLRQHPYVTRCHLSVDGRPQGSDGGAIRIHLSMPGAQLHAARRALHRADQDFTAALNDVLLDLRRQLRDLEGRRSTALLPRHT